MVWRSTAREYATLNIKTVMFGRTKDPQATYRIIAREDNDFNPLLILIKA